MTDEKVEKSFRAAAIMRGKKKRRQAWLSLLRRVIASALAVFTGYVFTGKSLLFGTYPLGLALVCSAEHFVAELVLGSFLCFVFGGEGPRLSGILCLICAVARYFLAKIIHNARGRSVRRAFSYNDILPIYDDISIRAAVAFFACFVCALTRIVGGGTFYDLFAGIFFSLTILIFTFLFSFAFDKKCKNAGAVSAGRASLVFCAVLTLADVSVFTVSVGIMAAYAITLAMGYAGDGARGAVAGLLVGIAVGGDYALLFAFSGLAAGIFYDFSRVLAFFMPLCVSVCAGLYIMGGEPVLAMLPEMLIASFFAAGLAFLGLLPEFSIAEKRVRGEVSVRELLSEKTEKEKKARTEAKITMLDSLSEAIKTMSESLRKPDKDHLSLMCREVFDKFCADCPRLEECRRGFRRGMDVVDSITERIMKSGKIPPEKYGEVMRFGCLKKDVIISEINMRAAKMLESRICGDRSRIFAFDYSAAARIIADTVAKSETVYAVDEALTEELSAAFSAVGICAENLLVCGERKKYIIATGSDVLHSGVPAEEIRDICEEVCGGSFTLPEYSMEESAAAMTLESTRVFDVEYAGKQCAKRGEKLCGDAIGITESREDFFYGFICDGMGSGSEAEVTARIGKTFLEKMLSCGNRKSTTLDMLNMFISNKSAECASTVDLLEIDLLRGKASFTKSGATASYIVRRGSVYKISSDTMPLGLLPEVCAEVTEFSVCAGDVIVMCSDGLANDPENDDEGGSVQLVEFLEHEYMQDVGKIAENLLFDAARARGRADDMTVGVFRVKRRA